jgi:CheY-like chemotaxis protein
LAEDHGDIRLLCARVLRGAGYEVIEADDGAEALAWLEREPLPDAIVTDLHMPRVDGIELVETVRARSGRACVVVLLSSERTLSEIAGRLGADAFVRKPFGVADLTEALARAFAARRE